MMNNNTHNVDDKMLSNYLEQAKVLISVKQVKFEANQRYLLNLKFNKDADIGKIAKIESGLLDLEEEIKFIQAQIQILEDDDLKLCLKALNQCRNETYKTKRDHSLMLFQKEGKLDFTVLPPNIYNY
jgi:hypothetical protein